MKVTVILRSISSSKCQQDLKPVSCKSGFFLIIAKPTFSKSDTSLSAEQHNLPRKPVLRIHHSMSNNMTSIFWKCVCVSVLGGSCCGVGGGGGGGKIIYVKLWSWISAAESQKGSIKMRAELINHFGFLFAALPWLSRGLVQVCVWVCVFVWGREAAGWCRLQLEDISIK